MGQVHDSKLTPTSKPLFDEVNEELVLQDDEKEIRIHCPLSLQKLSIAGYEVIKTWFKFHSSACTHCTCSGSDIKDLLDFLNSLAHHVRFVADIDAVMHDIVDEKVALICPAKSR